MVIGAWENEVLIVSGQQKICLAKSDWVKLRLDNSTFAKNRRSDGGNI